MSLRLQPCLIVRTLLATFRVAATLGPLLMILQLSSFCLHAYFIAITYSPSLVVSSYRLRLRWCMADGLPPRHSRGRACRERLYPS